MSPFPRALPSGFLPGQTLSFWGRGQDFLRRLDTGGGERCETLPYRCDCIREAGGNDVGAATEQTLFRPGWPIAAQQSHNDSQAGIVSAQSLTQVPTVSRTQRRKNGQDDGLRGRFVKSLKHFGGELME